MVDRASLESVVRKSFRFSFALACLVAAVAGCSRKNGEEAPVATPSFSLARDRVAIGSPVKLTYRFQVASDAKIDGDYWVFVHVLDPQGEQLWTDDHLPPTPTSRWKPGETIEYTRTIFVPNYPYIGEAAVRLGLYSQQTNQRLKLSGTEASRREYVVGRFQLLPQSENVFLLYKDGWYPAEVAADNPASEWQWTQSRAVVSFRNPKKDSTLYIEFDARVDLFTPPQQVTVRLGDQTIGTFAADSRGKKLQTFPVTAAQLGSSDMSEIVLEVDRTFKPGGADTRDLGIRVFHAFIEPK
jgi:hypothetical protein